MKRFLFVTLICFATVIGYPRCRVADFYEKLPELVEKIDCSTCVVLIKNKPNGSGMTIIRKNEVYVWTAFHVISPCFDKDTQSFTSNISVAKRNFCKNTDDQTLFIEIFATVEAFDEDIDVAILKLSYNPKIFSNTEFDLTNNLKRGNQVFNIANFLGWNKEEFGRVGVSIGVFSQKGMHFEETKYPMDLMIMTACVPGCSGSGLYNEDGKCIGILVRGFSHQGILTTPNRVIQKWAKDNNLMWALLKHSTDRD